MRETIAVWFSCGAASAVAAKLTVEKYGKSHNVIICNSDIKEEDEDNQRFARDIAKWTGREIISVSNTREASNSAKVVWAKKRYMSGTKGAPCTGILKK
jgi:hypothetical protein